MGQIILACDDQGQFIKYIPKEEGHKGEGIRHLAIAVLLFNSKDEVLLQKRKHKIFDNIWDLTGATHVLHKDDKDETIEQATLRCLEEEWGIIEKMPLENFGFFNYFAKYNGDCEHEHCYLMVGEFDGGVKLNEKVGYEYKWMKKEDFFKDMKANPQNYTPWAVKGIDILTSVL